MKLARTIGAFCLIALISACGPYLHRPSADTHKLDPITEFRSDNAIRLYNDQPSNAEVIIRDTLGQDTAGNLRVWTDVAIEITARELRKRGFTISDDAPRSLGIKVARAHTEETAATFETTVEIETREDDGKRSRHLGRNKAIMMTIMTRHMDGALMRAVAAMLGDAELVAYLTAPQ